MITTHLVKRVGAVATSEIFIPIDCTDTSTSQLTTSSMPVPVLLQDTVCQLFSENAIVFEDSQQRIFDHTEVTSYTLCTNDHYYSDHLCIGYS